MNNSNSIEDAKILNEMTLYFNNELIIDHLYRTFHLMKNVNFRYFPKVAFIDLKDKMGIFENIKTDDYPSDEEMIVRYEKKLFKKLKSKKIKSYCIAYEVIVQRENQKQKSNAIAFKIRNGNQLDSSILYYSYKLDKYRQMVVTDTWAENIN